MKVVTNQIKTLKSLIRKLRSKITIPHRYRVRLFFVLIPPLLSLLGV